MPPSATDMGDAALRFALRRLSASGRNGRLSILIFHRVLPEPDPIFPDEIDQARFDRICSWLRTWFNVLPLKEALDRQDAGELPERALAITFDDGYADNHDVAVPILLKHGIGATFFIASGYLDGGRMWNDTIVEAIRRCQQATLGLEPLELQGLTRLEMTTPEARRRGAHELLAAIKYLPQERRQQSAETFAALAQVDLPNDLMMTTEQVRRVHRAGMQIGAHTISHPILARVDDKQAAAEIQGSKMSLEATLQEEIDLFAYPNGKPGRDYGPRDVDIVRKLGFKAAVSTAYGAREASSGERYQIPRFTPWDIGRWSFGVRMARNLRVRGETV